MTYYIARITNAMQVTKQRTGRNASRPSTDRPCIPTDPLVLVPLVGAEPAIEPEEVADTLLASDVAV